MTQTDKLYNFLLSENGRPKRTDEIVREVYAPGCALARVGARVWDARKKYAVRIEGWHDRGNAALYHYAIIPFNWGNLFDEEVKLGADKETAFYRARQKYELSPSIQLKQPILI